MKTLNIGILAHVDAGKTSLTERLLCHAGVIDAVGSVDAGTTRTDSMELERRRGITIRSAVASFVLDDLRVNLIDTPGHADFVSEVERALRVLDGAVLVVSAVEGVQAHTRVLMRVLNRLRIPALIFVNKIDRTGAQYAELLEQVRGELAPRRVAMNVVSRIGDKFAEVRPRSFMDEDFRTDLVEVLSENSDSLLESYVDDPDRLDSSTLRAELATQVADVEVRPVLFGSAMTGVGISDLVVGLRMLLPSATGSDAAELSGLVFKIERGPAGEKIAYLRVYSGSLSVRQEATYYRPGPCGDLEQFVGRVTAIQAFDQGHVVNSSRAAAGRIVKLWGLKNVQIGDQVGMFRPSLANAYLPPPSLETVIHPKRPDDRRVLFTGLQQLSEQDPLINIRKDEQRGQLSVRLYGEVQKEIIRSTLADDFGVEVEFDETEPVYFEKPVGVGTAVEEMSPRKRTDFWATIGLRVEPGPPDSGITYRLEVEPGSLPSAFHTAIEDSVHSTLRQGLRGWEATDCQVTLIRSGFGGPVSTAGDFRGLTPLLLMAALREAGTAVCEPVSRFELDIPADTTGGVLGRLAEVGAIPHASDLRGETCHLEGVLPTRLVQRFERQLPALSRGEGLFLAEFHAYSQVIGSVPTRARTDDNPLDREEYLARLSRRATS